MLIECRVFLVKRAELYQLKAFVSRDHRYRSVSELRMLSTMHQADGTAPIHDCIHLSHLHDLYVCLLVIQSPPVRLPLQGISDDQDSRLVPHLANDL